MKITLTMLGAAVSLSTAHADGTGRVKMRDAVTHDQIVEAAREARKNTPGPVFTPAPGEDPSVANRPKDLLTRSEILCHLGKASLVPKRAVLHVPKPLTTRMAMHEGAQFVPWRDFLIANRAWIRTVPVSRTQAEGRHPIDEETLASFAKESRVVVAIYQDGPISVMPLRVPPPTDESATGGQSGQKNPTTTSAR